ncbi:MAG: shikimate kinase [Bryobacteraceae bacterium]
MGAVRSDVVDLTLKRTPGLFLVGFMACGKSTVGPVLAAELGWRFSDLDIEIEAEQQTTIAQIFSSQGEPAFRALETEAIRKKVRQIQAGHPHVVALGGGAFLQPDNWELVKNNGITIWLDCSLERISRRLVGNTTRPLAASPEHVAQLLEDRRSFYARADHRIDADCDDVEEVTRRILDLPIF